MFYDMADKNQHILEVQEDNSKQTSPSSGLKLAESDNNLSRKSLPPKIFAPNSEVSAIDVPRSCSANGAYSQDTPPMVTLPMESKAAFEDNSPLVESKADIKAKSSDNAEETVLRSQNPGGELSVKQKTDEKSENQETRIESKEKNSQNQHYGKETNGKNKIPSNDVKTSRDIEEQSDTIQPLTLPPFVQADTNRRRRSSTASLQHFPTSSPPDFMGTPRSRRVSTVDASIFSTPSTSGQADTLQTLRETVMSLPTESSTGTGVPESRRGSQARRRSSVAASMLNSDTRDGKKGSIGFTLAASLVKWKMNTLRAARRANETIAKDAKHQEFMDKTADRIKTELPKPLLVSIQEEAYPIILRTAQAYRSQLGVKHKLTMQAYDRLANLVRDLKTPY